MTAERLASAEQKAKRQVNTHENDREAEPPRTPYTAAIELIEHPIASIFGADGNKLGSLRLLPTGDEEWRDDGWLSEPLRAHLAAMEDETMGAALDAMIGAALNAWRTEVGRQATAELAARVAVQGVIERSKAHGGIEVMAWSEARERELLTLCDDCHLRREPAEFWGEGWRVLLRRIEQGPPPRVMAKLVSRHAGSGEHVFAVYVGGSIQGQATLYPQPGRLYHLSSAWAESVDQWASAALALRIEAEPERQPLIDEVLAACRHAARREP